MNTKAIIVLTLLFFFTTALFSQHTLYTDSLKQGKRPKIGLVLSGGGAKGLAHIGVLKVLEECGIRPDFITGTSMGSIVGGLYALGYTTAKIESILEKLDWNILLTDKITLRDIEIFNKNEYPGYPLKLIFDKKQKPGLPSGMVEGQHIHSLLLKLCWLSNKYKSFDEFPIPFRCVATDIMCGQAIVFKSGNLADAMRASMSIPSVFSPIIRDTMLLADGGMVCNYPVQECLDMGADIIIGSYTGFNENAKPEDLHSITKILTRSSVFQGIIDAKIQLPKTDILISPNLQGYNSESFTKAKQIIQAGEKSARDSIIYQKLVNLGKKLQKYPVEKKIDTLGNIRIDQIMINGNSNSETNIIKELCNVYPKMEVNAGILDSAINKLYATGDYKTVSYSFENHDNSKVLVFNCKHTEPGKIEIGLNYDNTYGSALVVRYSMRNFLLKPSLFKTKIALSENFRMQLDYDYFLTKGKKIALFTQGFKQLIKMPNVLKHSDTVIVVGHYNSSHFNYNAGIKFRLWRNGMFELAFGQNFDGIRMKEGMQYMYDLDEIDYSDSYLASSFKINNLDDPFFPTRGACLSLSYKSIFKARMEPSINNLFETGLASNNEVFQMGYKQYFRIKNVFSIVPEIGIGLMRNNSFLSEKFYIGGNNYQLLPFAVNMSGLNANNLATNNYIKLGLGFQLKLYDKIFVQFGQEVLEFVDYKEIYSQEPLTDGDEIFAFYGGLGISTPVGPLRLICSKNFQNKGLFWSLNLGIPF